MSSHSEYNVPPRPRNTATWNVLMLLLLHYKSTKQERPSSLWEPPGFVNFCKEKGQKGAVKQGTARLLQRQKLQAPQTTDTMQGHPTQEGHILPQTLLLNEKIKQKMNSPPPYFPIRNMKRNANVITLLTKKKAVRVKGTLKPWPGPQMSQRGT